ncbi:MAG: DUF349 domain-containing protein [Galbitalea sp.]
MARPKRPSPTSQRKYVELAGQVTLLEQRAKRGAPAADIAKTVKSLTATVATANAVGDLGALQSRLEALGGTVTELTEKQTEESKALLAAAIAERTQIVVEVEKLAAQDPAKAQWKQVSASLDEFFARWQKHQQDGPRLPKNESNELWSRFRAARAIIDGHRKAFFNELDSTHKDARTRKQDLVARAEALLPKGADGIPAYRGLLDEWKLAGRAGKKFDDALWAKFKAAGDALYSAKSEVDARDSVEFDANLAQKLELLTEAEQLLTATDRAKAKESLASIQRRWDKIGKVPRDKVKVVEDRLRRVETAVRKLDEEHWQRSDPEKQARSQGARQSASRRDREARSRARRREGERRQGEGREGPGGPRRPQDLARRHQVVSRRPVCTGGDGPQFSSAPVPRRRARP